MKKFLPIGTVCDLVNDSKKYMIIGYNQGGNDYESLSFPIGSTNGLNTTKFNHDSINEIYSLGYKDTESINYVNSLTASSSFDRILQFDENGVVISDGANIPLVTSSNTLRFDENGVVIGEPKKDDAPVSNIKFDENGVVISDGRDSLVENPSPVDSLEVSSVSQPRTLKFDENGVVIGEEELVIDNSNSLQFDENGVVIGESKKVESPVSNIKFDENGIIISE